MIPSPCKGQCRLDAERTHCTGCLRTLDEIRSWSSMNDDEKKVVWTRLLALAPKVKQKTCQQCGAEFECGSGGKEGGCWCQNYPPVMSLPTGNHDCLCESCLSTVIEQKVHSIS